MKEQLFRDCIEWVVPEEDDAVHTIYRLAAGTIEEAQFIAWVRSHCRSD